jgi:hypothetical protein
VTTKKLEPKQLLDRMRNEAAELLKYDLNNLTAAQSVRLDRAAALRLELDDVQSRQLAGLPIDMAKFVVASEALERLVGGNPEALPSFDADASIAAVVANIDGLLRAREQADHERDADLMWREEMAAVVAAGGDPSFSKPAGGEEAHGSVAHPLSAAPAVSGGEPEPASPPRRIETDVERMTRINSTPPPDHYLKQPDGEWRRWVDENGIRSSPWSRRGY